MKILNGRIEETVKTISNINEIKLIKELPDGTKQYSISSKQDKDIRKEIFAAFAKNEMTIFELKKAETSLEDVFIDIIDNQKEEIKVNEKDNHKEEAKKENKKIEKNKQNKKGGDK